jgi:hypothetical protein
MQEMKESYCHLDQVNKSFFLSVWGGVQNASLILHFSSSEVILNIDK